MEHEFTRSFTSRELACLIMVLQPVADGATSPHDAEALKEMARIALDAVVAFPMVEAK